MSTLEVQASVRVDMGKGASRRLRHANQFPAVIYGNKQDAVSLTIQHNKFLHLLEDEAFYSSILNIVIDDKKEKVILKDLQRHPYKQQVLHADFQRVSSASIIEMSVPLHFTNEDNCIGAKQDGGNIFHTLNEISIKCAAQDLPEYIEIDMTDVQLGQTLHLTDVTLPENVSLADTEVSKESDNDLPVVMVVKPKGADEDNVASEDVVSDSEEESKE